jgi:hypothetical protein
VQQKGEWQCFRLGDTNSAHALKHAAAVGSADCRFYMNKKGNGTEQCMTIVCRDCAAMTQSSAAKNVAV